MKPQTIKKIIHDRITGVWVADHTSTGHRYLHRQSGIRKASVTTCLGILSKPHLTKWAVKMGVEWLIRDERYKKLGVVHWQEEMIMGAQLAHTDIRDEAGSVGTQAHNAAERYINDWLASGVMPDNIVAFAQSDADPRAIASMRAVEAFFKKHDIVPLASEILVGDIKYSAGTLDFLALMDGVLTLIDFKTSNAVDQIGYSAQVAAYKFFFENMTGLKIKQCKILHLSKDYDKFDVWKITNINKAWKAFKQICNIYDWIYGTKDKIIKDIKRITI